MSISTSTHTRAVRKSVTIPSAGDFLTDGVRLVEVVGKCREGYRVIDANAPVEDEDEQEVEVLNPEVIARAWRPVKLVAADQ